MGCHLSGTGCSSKGPHKVTSPPLSMGPQVLQGTAPAQASHSFTVSSRHPTALVWGLLHHEPPRAVGAQLPHHGLYYEIQGNLFPAVEHLLPLLLHCSWACRAVALTCSYSSFWLWLLLCSNFLPPPCPAATKTLQCKPNTIPMNVYLFKVAEPE